MNGFPSTTTTQDLADRRADLQQMNDRLDAKGQNINEGDVAGLKALVADIERLRRLEIDESKAFVALLSSAPSEGHVNGNGSSVGGSSKSAMFTADQQDGLLRAIASKGSFSTDVKAPTLGGSLLAASGQTISAAPNATGLLPLASLFEQVVANGPTVRTYKLTTGSAAVVAEGALKPDAGIVTTAVDAALLKIATTFQISSELLEDARFLIDSIQRQAVAGIVSRENVTLVAALSAASGALTGTGTKATALDVVASAIGAAEAANGVTPSAVLLAPADLAVVRTTKASTGGSYYVDPLLSGPTTLHGVPLISSPAVPSGTAYLVSSGAGLFYRRGPLRIDSGYSGDDWQRNLCTVRVEERVLPVVVRGELVSKLTLT